MDKRSKVKICAFFTFYCGTNLSISIVFPRVEAWKFQKPANFYRCDHVQFVHLFVLESYLPSFDIAAEMNKEADDVEQNVGQLRDDSQIIHEKLSVFRLGLIAWPTQFVIDEVSVRRYTF